MEGQRFVTRILAAVIVAWASCRVAFWSRRVELLDLPARLRRTSRLRGPLAQPLLLARALRRLDRVLPPRSFGPCLRQSLILVDLLGRCGVEARVHCGVRRSAGGPAWEGHAWVSVGGERFPLQSAPPAGFEEIWAA